MEARAPTTPSLPVDAAALAAAVKGASRDKDWDAVIMLGRKAIEQLGASTPPVVFGALRKALRSASDVPHVLPLLERAWAQSPSDEHVVAAFAEAMILHGPPEGAAAWKILVARTRAHSPDLAAVLERAGATAIEQLVDHARHVADQRQWPEAALLWQKLVDATAGDLPPKALAGWRRARGKLLTASVREASAAIKSKEWAVAAKLWGRIVSDYGDDAPPQAKFELERAQDRVCDGDAALDDRSPAERWVEVAERWRGVIDTVGVDTPAHAYVSVSRAYRHLDMPQDAAMAAEEGLARHRDDRGLLKERAVIATTIGDWPMSFRYWARLADVAVEAESTQFAKRKAAAAFLAMATGNTATPRSDDFALLRQLGQEEATSLAVDGILALRSSEFAKAQEIWDRYWHLSGDKAGETIPFTVDGFQRRNGNDQFPVAERNPIETPRGAPGTFCVYTAVFGAYDEIRPPLYKPPGVDFICFSDQPIRAPGWMLKLVERPNDHPGLSNRRLKIIPYDYVGEYRYSLYVDSNIQLLSDISLLHSHWLEGKPFVGWLHSARSDVYDELETILIKNKHPPKGIIDQYSFFYSQKMPRHVGLIEASVLWRDHRAVKVQNLMRRWWAHLERFGYRDQPGLAYLLWREGFPVEVLPAALGNMRHNSHFIRHGHRLTPFDVERAVNAARRAGS